MRRNFDTKRQITSVWQNRVKPLPQKYFSLPEFRFAVVIRPARAAMRDASRSSRNVVRVAMGRCWRQVISSPGETSAADGEVVWSWRRDPGVYPGLPVRAGQRGQERPFPEESSK